MEPNIYMIVKEVQEKSYGMNIRTHACMYNTSRHETSLSRTLALEVICLTERLSFLLSYIFGFR